MKVLIDVDALTPPLTGIGQYTLNLVRGLQAAKQIDDLKFIRAGRVIERDQLVIKSVPDVGRQLAKRLPFRPLLRWGYQKYSTARFFMQSRALSEFIYHAPNYTLLPFDGRSVVTVHDLSFLRHPEFHPVDRVQFWSKQIHQVIDRASHIITDSEFQRREIMELLNLSETKVSSVYLGVDPKFRPYQKSGCHNVVKKYRLSYKQFNLIVATVEPRKNFHRILSAFNALPVYLKEAFPLVIVGDKGWMSGNIHVAIDKLIEAGYAKRLGYVADEDLPMLYAAAAVFVYPSLYEGFGLPVLEAMASGTAVLTSNTTSIPEIAGVACMLVDPTSTDHLIGAWHQLISDEKLRLEYAKLGKERAKQFTWNNCLNETLTIYKKLADG